VAGIPNTIRKAGIFYFRRAIPKSLRIALGRCELVRSLQTHNQVLARSRSRRLYLESEALFELAGETTFDRLSMIAAEKGVSPARYAAIVIEESLGKAGSGGEQDAASAEQELYAWVASLVDHMRGTDWTEDVTCQIFRQVEQEKLGLYRQATGIDSSRVNRSIGSIVKSRLGARTIMRDGRPKINRPRANQTKLITGYTLLEPDRR
jgi:hypothetical protein